MGPARSHCATLLLISSLTFDLLLMFVLCSKPSGSEGNSKLGGGKKTDGGSGGADFDPSKANFHPVDDACWKRGQK